MIQEDKAEAFLFAGYGSYLDAVEHLKEKVNFYYCGHDKITFEDKT